MAIEPRKGPATPGRWQPGIARAVDLSDVRRSRFVGAMKLGLPLLALTLVGLVLAWPQLYNRVDKLIPLSFSKVELSNAALTMQNARYRGTDRRNQPFIITADTATQDPSDPKLMTLDKLAADLSTSGGGWLNLNANTGLYQQDTKTLMLYGDINIFTDRGYEFHGTSADVNVNAGTVASDDKVWGQGPFGLLRANGLRVYDKGERIVFINGVHTTLFTRARG